jgi:hypothetical protein
MFLNEELAEGEESELDFEGYRVEREDWAASLSR